MPVTIPEINTRFEELVASGGYAVTRRQLESLGPEGRIAENPYFALVFQPFDTWTDLISRARDAEMELASSIEGHSPKNWDIYLLLACREKVVVPEQLNQLVQLQYDTRRMRKLIVHGVAEELSLVDELVRPFVALERIQLTALTRNPLASLADKLVRRGQPAELVARAISLFQQGGSLDSL